MEEIVNQKYLEEISVCLQRMLGGTLFLSIFMNRFDEEDWNDMKPIGL